MSTRSLVAGGIKDYDRAASRNRRDRRKQPLFINARKLGTLIDRVHRELTDADLEKITSTYHAWRSEGLTPDIDLKYLYHLVKFVGLNHLKDGTSNPTLSRGISRS